MLASMIDDDHRARAEDQRARKVLRRVLHLAGDEREVGPPVVRPQHRHEREPERRDREAPRRERRREMAAGLRQPDRDRDDHDEQQAEVLRDRRDVLEQRAPPNADVVEPGDDRDGERRDVVDPAVVRRDARIESEHSQQVFGERRRDRAERRRANDRQLGPAEKERRKTSPRIANEDEDAARLGECAGDLGQRERAAQRDDSAGDPDAEERKRTRQSIRDARRRSEDPRADRDADDDGDGAPQTETARKLRGRGRGWSGGSDVGHSIW